MCEEDNCSGTYSSNRYAGVCDPDGCDFNSYRQGNKDFYGPGKTVNTNSKFTVVTQFLGSGSTLESIRRFYVQGGKTIANSESTIAGNGGNQIDEAFCASQKVAFGDTDSFKDKGGLQQMAKALAGNMVLVMSLWDDVSFFSPSLLPPFPLLPVPILLFVSPLLHNPYHYPPPKSTELYVY